MKILVLEYITAIGIDDPSLWSEGQAMLDGFLEDFKDMDVDYLISLDHSISRNNYCNPVKLEGELMDWLDENISNYDSCLVIAPEEDFILYDIVNFIEKKGVEIIGSSSDAVMKCSDKFKMYESLKGKVPIIETEKVFFNEIDSYKQFNNKRILKPADGVSCSGVHVVSSNDEMKKAASLIETNLPYFIIQNFIEGISASVSLISNGREAVPLSLNLQDIHFTDDGINYNGGKVPLIHELEDEAKEVAKRAVESMDGLKGYVGVDMILGKEVYLVEINSRITTPYVALRCLLNFNLGDAILDSIYGKLPTKINLSGAISFCKKDDVLKLEKVA